MGKKSKCSTRNLPILQHLPTASWIEQKTLEITGNLHPIISQTLRLRPRVLRPTVFAKRERREACSRVSADRNESRGSSDTFLQNFTFGKRERISNQILCDAKRRNKLRRRFERFYGATGGDRARQRTRFYGSTAKSEIRKAHHEN